MTRIVSRREYVADAAPEYVLNSWPIEPLIVRRLDLLSLFAFLDTADNRSADHAVAEASTLVIAEALRAVLQAPEKCRCIACERPFRRREKPDAFLVGAIDRLRAWPVCSACEAQPDAVIVQRGDATLAKEKGGVNEHRRTNRPGGKTLRGK